MLTRSNLRQNQHWRYPGPSLLSILFIYLVHVSSSDAYVPHSRQVFCPIAFETPMFKGYVTDGAKPIPPRQVAS